MKTLHLALAFLCLFLFHHLQAQQAGNVEGTIRDAVSKEPLPGVSVRIKSTNRGTVTDDKGRFTINAKAGDQLEISFIGYTMQTVRVTGAQPLNIAMEVTNSSLQETVVIGYQSITRKKSTAAISSISGKELQNLPSSGFDQLLQGRLSGVNVQNFSGEPGARSTVSVRGNSLVNRGYDQFDVINSPLYVVDGVPQPTEGYVGPGTGTGTNFLAGINPVDIETVDVLKDASAAAIYGSRAANGVILITTKKGRSSPTRVSLSSYFGLTQRPELRDVVLGAEERRQKLAILEERVRYSDRTQLPYLITDSLNPAFNGKTDWQDMFYRTGTVKNADLSLSGGSGDMNYRFTTGYYNEQGIVKGTDFSRYSSRLNLFTRAMNGKLDISPIIYFSHTRRARGNGDPSNPISVGAGNMPSSLFNLDPSIRESIMGRYKESLDQNVSTNFNFNINLGYAFTQHLKFNTQNSYMYLTSRRDYNRTNELNAGGGNSSNTYSDNGHNLLSSNYFSYFNTFGKHNLSVILGMDAQFDQFQNTSAGGWGGVTDQIQVIQGFRSRNTYVSTDYQAYGLLSYYARLAYEFNEKYLFSFSARRDGSSRFGENSKWGSFPSASAAWLLSEEEFARNTPFSLIKIRGSVGASGSLPRQNYLQYNLYRVNNGGFNGNGGATSYNGVTAITPDFANGAAQKGLSWERSVQWNFGGDFELDKGRYTASIDVYRKENSLQLFSILLPVTSGYDNALTNAIGVRNSGVELSLSAFVLNPKTADKPRWLTRLNLSFNRNEIMALPNGGRDIVLQGDRFDKSHILSVGKPVNAFYLYQTLGVYKTDDDVPGNRFTGAKFRNSNYVYKGGDFHLADLDGDYFIDIFNDGINPDKMPVGDPNPKVTGGFTNDLSWKNFSLNIFCTFTFGRDVLNLYRSDQFANSQSGDAVNNFVRFATPDFSKIDIWRSPGDDAEYAKYDIGTYGYYYTSAQTFFLEKGDYFRIKNVTLSYNLPSQLLRRFKLDRLRFFGVVDNLAMFQASRYLPDAEAVNPYGEYNGNGYPIPKKFTLGFDLNF